MPSLLLVHILLRERAEREIVFALVDAYTHVGRRVAVVERDGVLAHLCLSRARDGEYPVADSVLGGHVAPCCLLPEFQVASGSKVLQQLDLPRLLHPLGGNQQFGVAHLEIGVGLSVGRLLAHAAYRVLHLAAVVAVLGAEGGVRLFDVLLRLQFVVAEDVVRPVCHEPVGIGLGLDSLRISLLVHVLVGNHHIYRVQVVGAHALLRCYLAVEEEGRLVVERQLSLQGAVGVRQVALAARHAHLVPAGVLQLLLRDNLPHIEHPPALRVLRVVVGLHVGFLRPHATVFFFQFEQRINELRYGIVHHLRLVAVHKQVLVLVVRVSRPRGVVLVAGDTDIAVAKVGIGRGAHLAVAVVLRPQRTIARGVIDLVVYQFPSPVARQTGVVYTADYHLVAILGAGGCRLVGLQREARRKQVYVVHKEVVARIGRGEVVD